MHWAKSLLCLFFGGVFVFSGVLKLRDPGLFLVDIRGFDMLPDPFAAWLALLLPWVEIICGLAVISGRFRSGGLLVLNLSLLMFFAAIACAQYRGLDIKCGCFGASEGISNYFELYARDAVLLAIGVALLFALNKNPGRLVPNQTT
jgi:putative oxidoreductase